MERVGQWMRLWHFDNSTLCAWIVNDFDWMYKKSTCFILTNDKRWVLYAFQSILNVICGNYLAQEIEIEIFKRKTNARTIKAKRRKNMLINWIRAWRINVRSAIFWQFFVTGALLIGDKSIYQTVWFGANERTMWIHFSLDVSLHVPSAPFFSLPLLSFYSFDCIYKIYHNSVSNANAVKPKIQNRKYR